MGEQIGITGHIPTRFVLITTAAAFNVATTVPFSQQLSATDEKGNAVTGLTWGKVGGLDAALFTLTQAGLLTMTAKNVAAPVDSNADNKYEVTVEAMDPQFGFFKRQAITVTVTP